MAHLQPSTWYFDKIPWAVVTRVTTDVDVLNDLLHRDYHHCGRLLMLSFVVAAMFRLSPGMTGYARVMPLWCW